MLRNIHLMRDLKPRQLLPLALGLRIENYYPGECIIKQGQKSDEIFFVKSGNVQVIVDGKPFCHLRKGYWFNLNSAFFKMRSIFEFTACHCQDQLSNDDEEESVSSVHLDDSIA